jgi:hypothetical protein
MEVLNVRTLKLIAVTAVASLTIVSAALAGGANCSHQASTCTAKQTAACTAGAMANCNIEAVRLSSGDLVVHYTGTTPEKFCCPMTQKMATNESCKVDVTPVSNGVLVFVTSPKKEVVDAYEKEFAALTTPVSK